MTRNRRAAGEKLLHWAGSSKKDLLGFPAVVVSRIGSALSVVQFGGRPPSAKYYEERHGKEADHDRGG